MSRNFELLTEIEKDLSAREPAPSTAARDARFPSGDSGRKAPSRGDQEMHQLVQRVFLLPNGSAPRRVVFFGADSGSNSSRVCAAAGRVLSSVSVGKVCLVDANVRYSRLSDMLSIDEVPRPVRGGSVESELCPEVASNLYLARLCNISAATRELPSREEIGLFLNRLDKKFDYVLIDAPDANSSGDALALSAMAEGSILVVEAHRTRKSNARVAKEKCDAAGVSLLGTVLDNRTFPIPKRLYQLF